jgi:hypothetical protein
MCGIIDTAVVSAFFRALMRDYFDRKLEINIGFKGFMEDKTKRRLLFT